MTAHLRGTQSFIGQMGWVFGHPKLVAIEISWRWVFGIPFLAICRFEGQQILAAHPPESSGLNSIDFQNPWVAAAQIGRAWALYQPAILEVLIRFAPFAALAWILASGTGRGLVLNRIDTACNNRVRPIQMIMLQAAWLALLTATLWGWFHCMGWAAARNILTGVEPDLVGFAVWTIFFALGFFTAWALLSWPLTIAPVVMLKENCRPWQAIMRSLRLGKTFNGKLIEINLVMGIVNLALIVLAMVLSAAPLPFRDQLGADTLNGISMLAIVFYLVATDYFQIVRLKGLVEFWKMFRGESNRQAATDMR